ncbi:hypothetical protein [Herbidospora daliensis]|uniref:hypothetical protein n=1 Tax=Herbidospora daliensis TaxID=295585 RepID=UPI000782144E|nr:hypothetical protein [Herbidospora daliensis]
MDRWPDPEVRFRTATTLSDLPGLTPAAFDPDAGAAGAPARLLGVEADGRWRCSYVAAESAGGLDALVPLYRPAGRVWPDRAYTPDPEIAPVRCLLVGGVYDRRTALHLPAHLAREGLRAAARIAVEEDRCLVFPFLYDRARRMVDAATGGRVRWAVVAHEARFTLGEPPSRVRGVLRRDRRLIERAATAVSVVPWRDADPATAGLVAAHNLRMGAFDDAEFVRLRHDQWAACEGVEVIVFDGRAGPHRGVLTALVWRGGLELHEIGLPPSDDPARLALYLDLIHHRPHAYARAHGLTAIRAGTAARTPKASRGAVFEPLHGGVLDAENTRRLARGPERSDG